MGFAKIVQNLPYFEQSVAYETCMQVYTMSTVVGNLVLPYYSIVYLYPVFHFKPAVHDRINIIIEYLINGQSMKRLGTSFGSA